MGLDPPGRTHVCLKGWHRVAVCFEMATVLKMDSVMHFSEDPITGHRRNVLCDGGKKLQWKVLGWSGH